MNFKKITGCIRTRTHNNYTFYAFCLSILVVYISSLAPKVRHELNAKPMRLENNNINNSSFIEVDNTHFIKIHDVSEKQSMILFTFCQVKNSLIKLNTVSFLYFFNTSTSISFAIFPRMLISQWLLMKSSIECRTLGIKRRLSK